GAPKGVDLVRRQGHAAAADHPHVGQAARAGGQQAGPVLRDRGDGGGGDHGDRDHHRAGDGRRDPFGGGRRLAVRRLDHLHRAGRAARPGARGADRGAVPRRLPVRHVPRRQPPAGRHRGPRRGVPRARAAGAHPPHPRSRSAELRRRRAAPGRRRAAARREARRAGDGPRAGRRLHVHSAHPRGGARDRALGARRARDHRRDPVDRRRRRAGRVAHRPRLVEGHGPARRHARGQPAHPRDGRAARRGRPDRLPDRRARGRRGGRRARALHGARARRDRRRGDPARRLRRPLHRRRRGRRHRERRGRALDPARGLLGPRPGGPDGVLAARQERRDHPVAPPAQGLPLHGRRPVGDRDPL
ncbi:MAG: Glucose-1-phosphate thymidylyltransferase, partial [uncultured Solirubrobacteraceae bacterium]